MSQRIRVVLQARTTSTRLPAKVLLPIGGMPLAILCARRLARSGREVVLATSSDGSDDLLTQSAEAAGIRVYRGSLDDVLGRFVGCVHDLSDDDIVVRASADNPSPDGEFVDELLLAFEESGQDYLGTSSPADGLPYGLSAEVFTTRALREVAGQVADPAAREHVTPELRRRAGVPGMVARGLFLDRDVSELRATIDTLEDYLAMAAAFTRVGDPVGAPWRRLISELPTCRSTLIPAVQKSGEIFTAVILGTAQLGLQYGIVNRTGRPNDAEAARILGKALEAGVTHLDTARAYGDAESRIRRLLPAHSHVKVVTKLLPLDDLPDEAPEREVSAAVDASVYGSCADLGRPSLDVVMSHRTTDLRRWGGRVLSRLELHVNRGRIHALGASVYSPVDAVWCLTDERFTHLQIPFNLLDSRWLDGDFQQALVRRPDVRVHVRSVFLQGLLIHEADMWPDWVAARGELVQTLDRLRSDLVRQNRADLCMAYVRSHPWVTSMVLGVETARQLDELLQLVRSPPLTKSEAEHVRASFVQVPRRLLNPSEW